MRTNIVAALLALLLLVLPAYAGEIHTRDGKEYHGDIRFMDNGTVVIIHDGQATALKNADIVQLLMQDAAKPGSHGLLGDYFQGRELRDGPRARRIDVRIDFTWAQAEDIIERVRGDQYSVRWTGQVVPAYSELYTFSTTNAGGVRVWVNNQNIFDAWREGHVAGNGQITLQAGQRYDIRVEYQNTGGDGKIQLKWTSPHQATEIIPAMCLFPPADTDIEAGVGLHAEYYAALDFQDHKNTHIDPMINFTWGGTVVAGIPAAGPFSIQWTGFIKPPAAGNYTFYTHSNGGVGLTINGIAVIDDWKAQAPADHKGTFAFTSDKKVPVMLQYFHTAGAATVGLRWSTGNQPPQNVPTACLFPDARQRGQALQVIVPTTSDVPAPSSGVMLSDGSVIAAVPTVMDLHGNVTLHWQQKDLTLPTERLAMVFQDQTTVQDDWAWPAERGAVLRNGDCVEGGIVSYKDGQVRVSSIIFGLKDYAMGDLRALLLRKPSVGSAGFAVRRNDGSLYTASALTVKGNSVVIDTDLLGQLTLKAGEIYSIKALK